MRYALMILDAPHGGPAAQSALRFARAAVARGHRVTRVFFYGDGVLTGSQLACPPQDEPDLRTGWREFAAAHGTELVLCIAAALRRGVLDETERQRYEKSAAAIDPAFTLAGLGQLADAALGCDRLLTFGSRA
ncbi:MAG: sulfurtransferase complex subunit TusD [Pseudomonadota bacterium]